MIKVHITSDKPGEGKSTVALMLMDLLKVHGFNVTVDDDCKDNYFAKKRDPRIIAAVKHQTNVEIVVGAGNPMRNEKIV